jgi:hypothetical protein
MYKRNSTNYEQDMDIIKHTAADSLPATGQGW